MTEKHGASVPARIEQRGIWRPSRFEITTMNQTFSKSLLTISMGIISLSSGVKSAQAKPQNHLVLPKIQVLRLQDTVTKRPYELYVKLPEGYKKGHG